MKQKLLLLATLLSMQASAEPLHNSNVPSSPVYNPSQQRLQQQMESSQQQQSLKLKQDQQREQQKLQQEIEEHRDSAEKNATGSAPAHHHPESTQE